jgi:hypothetical protein
MRWRRKSQSEARLSVEGSLFAYSIHGEVLWSFEASSLLLLAEYTTESGPLVDDHYLLFFVAGGGSCQASFHSEGVELALRRLSDALGAPIEPRLCNSTGFTSGVLWPDDFRGQGLFAPSSETDPGKRGVISTMFGLESILCDVREEIRKWLQETDSPRRPAL